MDTVLELEIGSGSDEHSYTVRVVRSVGGGQPSAGIRLDVGELLARRPLLEASVLASAVSARRVMSDTEAALQGVGVRLFETVFAGEVGGAYRASAAVAAERGSNLQLVLRLTAPGLAALPWEALFDAETGTYIARREPLVRHVPAPYTPDALALEPPLRILGVVAAPSGLESLDVDAEHRRLEEALRDNIDEGLVELVWLDNASWASVHRMLLQQPWHVLHFIGHGGYDTATDEGVLALVGSDGRADFVTATSLTDLLQEASPTPRLVVLNACQSGAASTTDLFSGTAAALAHSGIHAVAAMQFPISDVGAIAFSRGLYTALARGRGIDEAVRSGRIGILGTGRGTLEWVTPVLYLRGNDTKLFDVTPAAARERTPPEKPITVAGTGISKPMPEPPSGTPEPPRPPRRAVVLVSGLAAVAVIAAVWITTAMLQPDPGPAGTSSPQPAATSEPVQLAVPAAVAWTSTGVRCAAGDSLEVEAAGTILHEPEPTTPVGPDGLEDPAYRQWNVEGLPDVNTVALIGSLDAVQPFFLVGSGTTYTCPRDGELYLGINDVGLEGNSGQFQASVTRIPAE